MSLTDQDKIARYLGASAEKDEWSVLACIAREGAWLLSQVQALGLTRSTFLDTRAGFVWEVMSTHTLAGSPLSEEALRISLDEAIGISRAKAAANPEHKPSYLALTGEKIADLLFWEPMYRTDAESATFIATRIVSRWQFRKAERELRKLLSESAVWEGTPESFVEEAQRRVLALPSAADGGKGVKNVGEHLYPFLDSMHAEYIGGAQIGGLRTGFPRLDTETNGMEPGDLVIVAAGSGVGKTSFAINAAAHVAQSGKRVLIFSLEMSIAKIMRRLIFMEAQVNSSTYRRREMTDRDWDAFSKASTRLCGANIDVVDDSSITLPRLHGIARQVMFSQGIDLIIVDYAQLLQTGEQRKEFNREQEVRTISDGLKRLASDLQVPVMLLSQLNDAGQLRESRSLKFNASHVWIISVSETQDGLGEDGKLGLTKRYELFIDKGRDSGTGAKIRMMYFPQQTRLEEESDMEEADGIF